MDRNVILGDFHFNPPFLHPNTKTTVIFILSQALHSANSRF